MIEIRESVMGDDGPIGSDIRALDSRARLTDLLLLVAAESLGPDVRASLSRDDWARVWSLLGGPAAAAAQAALDRLAEDLDSVLTETEPELLVRLDDARRRVEAGFD